MKKSIKLVLIDVFTYCIANGASLVKSMFRGAVIKSLCGLVEDMLVESCLAKGSVVQMFNNCDAINISFIEIVSGITDVSEVSILAEAVDGSLDVGSDKMWW